MGEIQTEERVLCIAIMARETTDEVNLNRQNKNLRRVEVARGWGRKGLARDNQ